MFIGFWEIVLILGVIIILILPEFSKSKKAQKKHRLRLYIIIAILLLFIIILSKSLFFLFSTVIGLIAFLGIILFIFYCYIGDNRWNSQVTFYFSAF